MHQPERPIYLDSGRKREGLERASRYRQRPVRQPLGGPLPGHPLIVRVLRFRLDEGIARGVLLGVDGVLRGAPRQ